jgi:cobalt-precorrin 5A hydrolase / cobalt-factor III methyltransferase / precorrin-3B C17-methyltransferase
MPRPAGPPSAMTPPARVLALGVGCDRGAAADEVAALALGTLAAAGLAPGAVACVATLDVRADEAAVRALAARLAVPIRRFTAAVLERETPRLANPSEAVFAAVGCHGVAEGAALAAAGPEGRLVAPKARSARATCAIAMVPAAGAPR